jgi:hypothetical protein
MCILILLIFCEIGVKGQKRDEIKVSGIYHNIGLITFLNDVEKKNSIVFFYDPEWFEHDSIDLFFNNTPLIEALDRAIKGRSVVQFQDTCFVFLPNDDIALLNGKRALAEELELGVKLVGDPAETGKYNKVVIKGTINDGKTGEPLIGSTVNIENTNIACVTNLQGFYSLAAAPGNYKVIVSNVGYERTFQKVKVVSNGVLNIELFEKATKINEIVVYAQKADRNVRSSQMSIVELDSKMIKQLPSMTGEKDIVKSFTMMPGVKSVGEFGAGINVRGGSSDQNLFLLEGSPLFNTSHVFGLISVINPDAVNNVTLYKGHIPSNFGERVSSVMEIQLKDNNTKELRSNGGIGIFNSRLMLEIPVYNENLSVKIGGRTNYSNWILMQMPDYDLRTSKIGFYDLNGSLTWSFYKNRVVAFAYYSSDYFKYTNELDYSYSNTLGSVLWSHYFSTNLNSSLVYSFSKFGMTKDDISTESEQSRLFSDVIYNSLKFNLTSRVTNSQTIDAGSNSMLYNILPGKQTPLNQKSIIPAAELSHDRAIENAIYFNDKWEINNIFSLNAGLRYSVYSKIGPGLVFNYQQGRTKLPVTKTDSIYYGNNSIIQIYNHIEPRVAFKVQVNETSSVKLSYNRNNQYISLISNTSVSSPDDIWKLSDKYVKPIDCSHYALGYYNNFKQNMIETSVEVYYKSLKDLVEYKNGAKLVMNRNIETELIDANGKNYGIELFIKKNAGEIDGWISYTYSRSLKQTIGMYPDEKVNNNQYYPSSFDKPHDITLVGTWHINRRMRLASNFNYSTGRSITLPELKYDFYGQTVLQYSDRNKYRLPAYHRLDLSFSVDESLRIKKKWKGSWTFSILNVYARKNAYSVYYKKETPTADNNYQTFNLYKLYIIGIPLPTFTYNFIF